MKKMITMIILSFLFMRCIAPSILELYIPVYEPYYKYNMKDPVLRSVTYFESRFTEHAVNKVSGARGIIQILPIMVYEVNRICKKYFPGWKYTWKDAFDPIKSMEIWYIVQAYWNPDYDIDKACIVWFGSGTQYDGMTWKHYSKEIKKRL
jgi:hypothetical protein